MGDHDALFKRIFAVPAHAAGELRSVLPPEVLEVIDLSRLELVSGASVSDHMERRYADLLFRAPLREPDENGRLIHLYMHVQLYTLAEHQSQPDVLMPLRSVEYKLGLWRQLLREDPTRKTLPPVITLVVHHGPGGWTAPRSLHQMVEGLDRFPMLAPFVPNEQLLVDDLAFVEDAALLARPLLPVPKMAVWLLRDGRDVDVLLAHIHAWADVLEQVLREDPGEALVLLRYISRIATVRSFHEVRRAILDSVATAEAPLASIAEELIQKGRQEGRHEGRQEGRQEGATQALRTTLHALLEQRFGSVPESLVERIAAASLQDLELAVSRVLVVADPSSLFQPH